MGCEQSKDAVTTQKQAPSTVDTSKKVVSNDFTNSFSQSVDYGGQAHSITTAASSDSIVVTPDYCDKACFGAGENVDHIIFFSNSCILLARLNTIQPTTANISTIPTTSYRHRYLKTPH